MNQAELRIEQEAVRWVRRTSNKRFLLNHFASTKVYRSSEYPLVILMAGSPGAGKTEFIKSFQISIAKLQKVKPVVIDPDAVREFLPGYTGANSYLFQRAISIAVDDLFRWALKNKQVVFL